MALYSGLLNNTCVIFRQTADYDPASTEYGEIDETWEMVQAGVKCRTDGAVPTYWVRGGIVEMGTMMIFMESSIDLQDLDVIYVDGKYFQVTSARGIDGYSSVHHVEAPIKQIEFVSPS